MKRPGFIATEEQSKEFVLVVDKKEIIGRALVKRLSKGMEVVYVRKTWSIPQYSYSYIFVIDDGTKITRKSLFQFLNKTGLDRCEFVFVVQKQDVLEKYVSKIVEDTRIKTVIIGDIFETNKFLQEALIDKKIRVENDGLSETYPVFLEDVVSGILEAAFSTNRAFRIFYLFVKHPPTQIAVAHMIQKADPEVKIDFKKTKKQKEQKITLPYGKYLLDGDYNLQDRIKGIFLKGTQDGYNNKISKYHTLDKNDFNPIPLSLFLSLVFLLLLPLILTSVFSFTGFKVLENAQENLFKGELAKAQSQFGFSKNFFLMAKKTLMPLVVEAKIVGRELELEPLIKDISIGHDTSLAGLYLGESLNKFAGVFNKKTKDARSDFMSASVILKESITVLQRAGIDDDLHDFDALIKLAGSDTLSSIFGFEGEKTYLVLFQDNARLMPTGGFIRSFGLLTMRNGAVKDFSLHDVYEADSKLKGHVEPPFPIRRYAVQQHWYLKDSNFEIDFVRSASKSAFFLDVEMDKKVDGVITIDTYFIQQLTSAIGPAEPLPYLSLAKIISDALTEKHILLAFSNPSIQDFFTVNNYSSSFWDKRLEKENVINDFVGINEANLGEKANYWVNRMVSNEVSFDDKGNIAATLIILYDNKSSFKLGGDYKNYLRIVLKEKAEILSISIDGKDQRILDAITDPVVYESKSFVAPKGLEVEKTRENGKSFFGFLVNVPKGEKQRISIKYSLRQSITLDKPSFLYSLNYFKQPGTKAYPFKLSIAYPLQFNPIEIPKEFEDKDGKISLIKKINSDENIQVRFSKK